MNALIEKKKSDSDDFRTPKREFRWMEGVVSSDDSCRNPNTPTIVKCKPSNQVTRMRRAFGPECTIHELHRVPSVTDPADSALRGAKDIHAHQCHSLANLFAFAFYQCLPMSHFCKYSSNLAWITYFRDVKLVIVWILSTAFIDDKSWTWVFHHSFVSRKWKIQIRKVFVIY